MPDEDAGLFPEPLKVGLESLLEGVALELKVLSGEEAKGIEIHRRWGDDRA
jgi:hypothetical protein